MSEVENAEVSTPSSLPTTQKTLADTPLRKFFEATVRFESSDLILRGGQIPRLRLRGKLKNLDTPPIEVNEFEQWINEAITDKQRQDYLVNGSLDLAVDLDGENRFRVNIFRTRGRSSLAARRVSAEILTFSDLHLPPACAKIAELHQGMVMLCGVTGSGKSTTIASMLQHINNTRACHIVTLEDPIEYLYKDDKAMINQREIGIDVPDFPTALKALMRENPDVVLIGEMRDKETFEAALQAAETGHLVFCTIHASSASQAFGRIYDLFPEAERQAIRNLLAHQMQAFMYQRLLPTIRDDLQRVPAVEILLQSPPTRKYIMEGREHELNEVMKDNRDTGMQTFVDSLVKLVEQNYIHPRVAQQAAPSAEEVKMRLRGISTG
ncbi:type IV pilus twitching motility protein PilT [Phycisphaerales bacterium AB-hyl4]|uniref:Type IV pilus twitching motility protein PilT n=1 Tax=Natronomicrosphaera hydrolytica TaxID=3242702 RepID=A0ABV4U5B7_9BACT